MTVSEMFERYRLNKAVFNNLLTEIKYLQSDTIEALQLPACVMSHIPRSETNKIHQPTEQLAIRLNTVNNDAVKALKQITKEIEQVENLLNELNERERFIITQKHINGASWREISIICEKNIDSNLLWSKSTLKSDKKRAEKFLQNAIGKFECIGKFTLTLNKEDCQIEQRIY